jgi:cytidylate kinase
MRITISGPAGSGTTSLARYLVDHHPYTLISAGEVFRSLAKEKGMELAEFGRLASEDPAIDRMIDERQKELGEQQDDIVIEGRLAGWMVENADLKIWLTASLECRAERIADREAIDLPTAADLTAEREECEAARYSKYYEIDINDLSPYHLILSSERWGRNELGKIVDTAIRFL